MFRRRVVEDLSNTPGRLAETDKILERQLRILVKSLITDRHTPRKSDLSPLGDFIGQTVRGVLAARSGDVEEAERSAEALNKWSKDPHYRQRNRLFEAIDIADKIGVEYLLDFCDATKLLDLDIILPGWRSMIQPPVYKYKKRKE